MSTTSYLVDYIESQLLVGVKKEQLIKSLLANKWRQEDIEIAFLELDKKLKEIEKKETENPVADLDLSTPLSSEIKPSLKSRFSSKAENRFAQINDKNHRIMPGVSSIASEAFTLYRERLFILVMISLIAQTTLGIDGYFFGLFFDNHFFTTFPFLKSCILIARNMFLIFLHLWLNGTVIAVISENNTDVEEFSIRDFFSMEKSKLFPLIKITSLFALISVSITAVIGSAIILAILFFEQWINIIYVVSVSVIIFCIIISLIWYILAVFFLFEEDQRGINALINAREYIKGRWLAVIYRFMFSGLFFIAIFLILFFVALLLPDKIDIIQINLGKKIIRFIMVFFVPLIWAYLFFIYQNLKDTKSEEQPQSKARYIKYLSSACAFGIMIIISTIIWVGISYALDNNSSVGFNIIKEQIKERIANSEAVKLLKAFMDF